jgi:hypothetical protein
MFSSYSPAIIGSRDSRVGVHNRVINKFCVTNSTYNVMLEEEYIQGKRIIEKEVNEFVRNETPFASSSAAGTVSSVALCLLDVLA